MLMAPEYCRHRPSKMEERCDLVPVMQGGTLSTHRYLTGLLIHPHDPTMSGEALLLVSCAQDKALLKILIHITIPSMVLNGGDE